MTVQKKILDLTGTQYLVQKITGEIPVKISDLQDDVTLGTHIADTDIHVTSSDKTTWNTVSSKADDSDVVHKSGDETISGVKTFSVNPLVGNGNTNITISNRQITANGSASTTGNHAYSYMQLQAKVNYADSSSPIDVIVALDINEDAYDDGKKSSLSPSGNNVTNLGKSGKRWANVYGYLANLGGTYVGNEISPNERTNLYLLANRDTDGQSGAYIGRFRQNRAQGAMSGSDVSFVSFDFLENSTRYTRCFTMGLIDWDSDGVPQTYYLTSPGGKGSLGTTSSPWNKVYANEYYYGSANTEFSSKFVTTDTAQTISGNKTFSDLQIISYGTQYKGARNAYILPDFAAGYSGLSIATLGYSQTLKIGNFVLDANNKPSLDASKGYVQFAVGENNNVNTCILEPKNITASSLGTSVNKWSKINGLEPSSLGMPDLNNGIDISSYITHLDKVVNNYTPPANGWLSIRVKKTSLVHASLMIYQTGGLLSSCETDEFTISGTNLPVIANQNVEIYIIADALASAKFFPCQGNV